MPLHIPALENLHQSMQELNVTRQLFNYTIVKINTITLSVAFLIDDSPFRLMFGCQEHNIFFMLDVTGEFHVDPFQIDLETYRRLCAALGLRYDPDNRYTRHAFLVEFRDSGQIIQQANNIQPRPHQLPVDRVTIDEGDRIYFTNWRINGRGRRVTPENIEKTRVFCGIEIANTCRDQNISSCWSANPDDEVVIMPP